MNSGCFPPFVSQVAYCTPWPTKKRRKIAAYPYPFGILLGSQNVIQIPNNHESILPLRLHPWQGPTPTPREEDWPPFPTTLLRFAGLRAMAVRLGSVIVAVQSTIATTGYMDKSRPTSLFGELLLVTTVVRSIRTLSTRKLLEKPLRRSVIKSSRASFL